NDRCGFLHAQTRTYFHAVDARQHDVKKNKVVILRERHIQSRLSVFRFLDDEILLLEIHAQQTTDALLIIHDKYRMLLLTHGITLLYSYWENAMHCSEFGIIRPRKNAIRQ